MCIIIKNKEIIYKTFLKDNSFAIFHFVGPECKNCIIKGLDKLINLEILYLDGNQLTEIKGLDNLKKLKLLFLGFNPIEGDFAKDVMGVDEVKNLLSSYKEWKAGK